MLEKDRHSGVKPLVFRAASSIFTPPSEGHVGDRAGSTGVQMDVQRTSPYEFAQTAEPTLEIVSATETYTLGHQTIQHAVEIQTAPLGFEAVDDLDVSS